MKNMLILVLIAYITWYGYSKYHTTKLQQQIAYETPSVNAAAALVTESPQSFACDGRTHCSQMRSCAEASYFIEHCPNTQMDGNHDGVPCERQWCN